MKRCRQLLLNVGKSYDELINELDHVLEPFACVATDNGTLYMGQPVTQLGLGQNVEDSDSVALSVNNECLAMVNLRTKAFSVFGSEEVTFKNEDYIIAKQVIEQAKVRSEQKQRGARAEDMLLNVLSRVFSDRN